MTKQTLRLKNAIWGALVVFLGQCGWLHTPPEPQPMSYQQLLEDPFSFELSVAQFKKAYHRLTLKKEPVPNRFVKGQTDTLYHLTHKDTKISFYQRADGTRLFFKAVITSKKIPLENGVYAGMKREDFEQCFKNTELIKGEMVTIKDDREGLEHKYYFNSNQLEKIVIENYID